MPGTLTARFETRREADLAIEHLVQQEGVRREAIAVSTVGDENTVGSRTGGADHADAQPGSRDREDAPLSGAVKLSVTLDGADAAEIRRILAEAGAREIK